jgi:hypothetical protein
MTSFAQLYSDASRRDAALLACFRYLVLQVDRPVTKAETLTEARTLAACFDGSAANLVTIYTELQRQHVPGDSPLAAARVARQLMDAEQAFLSRLPATKRQAVDFDASVIVDLILMLFEEPES